MPEPGALSDEALPLDVQWHIDAVCLAFEAAWQASSPDGNRPRLEDYLTGDGPERAPLLCELLKLELDYRRGERPTREEYLRRFPADGPLLGPLLNGLRATAADPVPGTGTAPGEGDAGAPMSAETAVPGQDGTPAGPAPSELPSAPGYQVLGVIGRGGMGVVYKARQITLKRLVALKMLRAGQHAGDEELARFRAEAEAVARLQHPNIVQIYEVGEHDGRPFFSMEYVEGKNLQAGLAGAPQLPDQAARLAETLAQAIHFAHERGIIHRDLKPANVLLMADGAPKVSDFGLAKQLDADSWETRTGQVMGTPSYMAPEQAAGQVRAVGPWTDVYALGAILYECLTGRPPFKGATVRDTLDQVCSQEPVPPHKLQPRTPRDLETIALKCLHKEPGRRYATARALAEDLGRYRRREPIQARPVGWWEQAVKFARRRPALTALVGVCGLAVLALVGLAVGLWYNGQLQGALHEADEQRREANRQRQRFQALEVNTRYLRDMTQAEQVWQDARVVHALRLLDRWRPRAPDDPDRDSWEGFYSGAPPAPLEVRPGDPDLRGWEWYYLRGLCRKEFRILRATETGSFYSVAFHPDSRRIAVADWNNQIHVWDVVDGRKLHTLRAHTGRVDEVAFSPDGALMASASWDDTVRLWDVASGDEIRKFLGHKRVRSVTFSPDGHYLASAAEDQIVILWDVASGKEIRRFVGHTAPVYCVTFSPDGKRLATTGADRTVRLWDAASGECLRILVGHTRQVSSVTFSPDGQTLATSSEDETIKLWDPDTAKLRATLEGHTAWVYRVAFSPDGRWLASASDDMTVRFWDLSRNKEARVFRGHEGAYLRGLAFSPDGRFLATTAMPGTVQVWDLASGPTQFRLLHPGHAGTVFGVAFAADSRRLASVSRDSTIQLWDVIGGRQIRILTGHRQAVRCVAFGADDKLLASGGFDGTVRLWDPGTGRPLHTLEGHKAAVNGVALSRDGRLVASASADGTVIVWDAASGQKVQTLRGHGGGVNSVAFSPDGRWLASAGGVTVKLWDTGTWQVMRTLEGFSTEVLTLAFSPDGSRLATAGSYAGDQIKLWDPSSGELIQTLTGIWGHISSVAFSPDGRRVAAGGMDRKVKLWDAASGQAILTLKGHTGKVYSIAFSPDGRWLASAGDDADSTFSVRLWEAPPDRPAEPEDRAALFTPEHVLRFHLNEAEDCAQAGQRSAALWHVNHLGHPPLTDPLLLTRVAGIRATFGLWGDVIDDADAVLRQQPDDPPVQLLRGQAHQKLGHHAEAVADFTAVLRLYPASAQLYELRAASQEALGKPDVARADREQATRVGVRK